MRWSIMLLLMSSFKGHINVLYLRFWTLTAIYYREYYQICIIYNLTDQQIHWMCSKLEILSETSSFWGDRSELEEWRESVVWSPPCGEDLTHPPDSRHSQHQPHVNNNNLGSPHSPHPHHYRGFDSLYNSQVC